MLDPNNAINAISREFRGSPVLLALVILNLSMFGMMSYLIVRSADSRFKERGEIIAMLDRCVNKRDL